MCAENVLVLKLGGQRTGFHLLFFKLYIYHIPFTYGIFTIKLNLSFDILLVIKIELILNIGMFGVSEF